MRGYDVTQAAEEDLINIWQYTFHTWGIEQADRYFSQIEACFRDISTGYSRSKRLVGIPDDVLVVKCDAHYVFYIDNDRPIIIAVLHGKMQFIERLKHRINT